MRKSFIIAISFFAITAASAQSALLKPDPKLTPGAINTAATKGTICVSGYTSKPGVRNVSQSTKNKVFKQYNIDPKSDKFEIDHLISLELGGSNDISNLWPESYTTSPLNAHVKDELENKLHDLVCKGKADLATVQREIAEDWTKAYEKYVGPLPR